MKRTLYATGASLAMAAASGQLNAGQKDGGGSPDIGAQITALGEKMAGAIDKLKEDGEKLRAEDKGMAEKALADYKSQTDERLTALNGLKDEMRELALKMDRGGGGSPEEIKSLGQKFASDEGLKKLAENRTAGGRTSIQVKGALGRKDISSTNSPGDTPGSAGALVVPDRRGLVDLPRRRMTIRGLLAQGVTTSNSIEYEKLVTDTNAAAAVAEGAALPQTELTFEDATAPVVDLGHMIRTNRNILDDAPRLASLIDGRLRYGLDYKEEIQILLGSGSAGNLSGLVTEATAYAAISGIVTAGMVSKIDVLRLAMLQAVTAEYAATGIVLNHIDWAGIELTKDSQGRYIIGNPQGAIGATLWGLPVAATNAMTADEFLVGDFEMGAELIDRQESTVEASTEDRDNFQKRKVSVAAFERIALPIYNPGAFITGDFSTILAAANP